MIIKELDIQAVDVSEDDLLNLGKGILEALLKDRTTGGNIIWATSDYEYLGEGYSFDDEITVEKITGKRNHLLQPRVTKDKGNQRKRSRDMAEVFTPSWICNVQNNLVDNAWFGRNDVFNTEGSSQHWKTNPDKITDFPIGKTWKTYVNEHRMEMACGEAPYLVSRYDTTTGEYIPVNQRIGLLDRKLRLVNENIPSKREKLTIRNWRRWAMKAFQSTYGFEWQGDNLLLAREAMLMTYIEYYFEKWSVLPEVSALVKVAEVISWNIWQMDGLTYGIPGQNPVADNLFSKPKEKYCRIMDWIEVEPLKGEEIIFKSLIKQ